MNRRAVAVMRSHVPDEQRKRITSFLAQQPTAVISTTGTLGVWAMPVWYYLHDGPSGSHDLEVDCLVPRWADVAYHLTEGGKVVMIVQASSSVGLRWLQIQGTAWPVETPDWACFLQRMNSIQHPDSLYLVVRMRPSRIDLVDETRGWGVQETLEW